MRDKHGAPLRDSLQILIPRWDAIVINSGMTGGHKTLVTTGGGRNKQTNKIEEIKWMKNVRRLITDANCFLVGGRSAGVAHVREGKRNLRISSLCVWPTPDFRAKPSLKRRSTPGSTFHLCSLWEHTKYLGLHRSALQYRSGVLKKKIKKIKTQQQRSTRLHFGRLYFADVFFYYFNNFDCRSAALNHFNSMNTQRWSRKPRTRSSVYTLQQKDF